MQVPGIIFLCLFLAGLVISGAWLPVLSVIVAIAIGRAWLKSKSKPVQIQKEQERGSSGKKKWQNYEQTRP